MYTIPQIDGSASANRADVEESSMPCACDRIRSRRSAAVGLFNRVALAEERVRRQSAAEVFEREAVAGVVAVGELVEGRVGVGQLRVELALRVGELAVEFGEAVVDALLRLGQERRGCSRRRCGPARGPWLRRPRGRGSTRRGTAARRACR